VLPACELNRKYSNRESDKIEAEAIINDFYRFLGEKNYKEAFTYIHPSLWEANDSVKISDFFINITTFSGGLKERKLDHWETTRVIGYYQSAYYKMYYINKYDNLELKVSLILRTDIQDGRIKIIGFQASPDKFL
jgi:hypothetical protein